MSLRALLIVNPHARQGRENFARAKQYLTELGFHLVEELVDDIQSASDIIRQYRDQVDLVIVGGGDGTLNAALDGLVATGLPLGILPLGTANDLALTLGIPHSLSEACRVIQEGYIHPIDLGWVNGKYFLTVASLGLSDAVTRQVTEKAKRQWGMLAYVVAAFYVFWHFRPFSAEVLTPDQSFSVKTIQIVVGNGRYYAGGLTVAQDAAIDDQRLDLYSLEIQHWWDIFTLLPAIRNGNLKARYSVQTARSQEIEIHTPKRPRSIDADGEPVSHTTAYFRVMPNALSVFSPKPSPHPSDSSVSNSVTLQNGHFFK